MATPIEPGMHHCARHRVTYGALEQCGPCETDPAPSPADRAGRAVAPPAGCLTTAERERELVAIAKQARGEVSRLKRQKKKDFHTEIAIKGYLDTAVKAIRAAHDVGMERESADETAGRLEDERGEAGH